MIQVLPSSSWAEAQRSLVRRQQTGAWFVRRQQTTVTSTASCLLALRLAVFCRIIQVAHMCKVSVREFLTSVSFISESKHAAELRVVRRVCVSGVTFKGDAEGNAVVLQSG